MANFVIPTPYFESKYKRLAKKFPTLGKELVNLERDLLHNPKLGEPLGSNLYKIRLSRKDKGKGKRGGFRIITYLIQEFQNSFEIYLITIFDKSEDISIPKSVLIKLVNSIFK
jgi:mRNA-degrading endonuclease RelE of RelBE toxin-antitoxin system